MPFSIPLRLLKAGEPPAVEVVREHGTSDLVLACDHASRRIPEALGMLGLSETELAAHIAWDIGAAEVAKLLSAQLDATLILQNYSRLVIDCNRPLAAPDSITPHSELVTIPGNQEVGAEEVLARRTEIFAPYHDRLHALLDERKQSGRRSVLIAVHSFTPVYRAVSRSWHVGLLYLRDARIADALLRLLRQDPHLVVGDNEPYAMSDASDYTLPLHGESRGIAHVGIEIRQDLIAEAAGQAEWAQRLGTLLVQAAGEIDDS